MGTPNVPSRASCEFVFSLVSLANGCSLCVVLLYVYIEIE